MAEAADRSGVARLGLAAVAVCLFLGNVPLTGLLPATLAVFVPRFRIIGWWMTVVVTLLLASVMTGGVVYLARNWSAAVFEAPGLARWSMGLMVGTLVGCLVALTGLLAPGTRRAVERRTMEVAPHAFDEGRP